MKKKALSLALALVMCLGLLPMTVLAADSDFTIEDGVLTKYNGSGGAVTIPDGVTSIGYAAFQDRTSLTSVTIPDSVTSIAINAFSNCTGLTSVTIPSSVTSIGEAAFQGCTNLTAFQVDANDPNYISIDGVLYSKDKKDLIVCPAGRSGSFAIPDGVASIGDFAFKSCTGLTSVTVPNSVTSIGGHAFSGCTGLTSVNIPNGVTSIGYGVFQGCVGLASVTIPDSVTSIDESAFSGCKSLTSLIIPNSVTNIWGTAFCDCTGLTSVTIPASVVTMGDEAFKGCTSLKDVYYSGSEAQWAAIETNGDGDFRDHLINAAIHYNSAGPTQPQQPAQTAAAEPTNDSLLVDGKPAEPTAYKIDGSNYFKLRDVAALLNGTPKQFNVGYDSAAKSAAITTGQGYAKTSTDLQGKPTAGGTATISGDKVLINGVESSLTVYKINGSNYFKLRDLGKALDFNVGWSKDRGMYIETGASYSEAN